MDGRLRRWTRCARPNHDTSYYGAERLARFGETHIAPSPMVLVPRFKTNVQTITCRRRRPQTPVCFNLAIPGPAALRRLVSPSNPRQSAISRTPWPSGRSGSLPTTVSVESASVGSPALRECGLNARNSCSRPADGMLRGDRSACAQTAVALRKTIGPTSDAADFGSSSGRRRHGADRATPVSGAHRAAVRNVRLPA
jgi:hypothetical protein